MINLIYTYIQQVIIVDSGMGPGLGFTYTVQGEYLTCFKGTVQPNLGGGQALHQSIALSKTQRRFTLHFNFNFTQLPFFYIKFLSSTEDK